MIILIVLIIYSKKCVLFKPVHFENIPGTQEYYLRESGIEREPRLFNGIINTVCFQALLNWN